MACSSARLARQRSRKRCAQGRGAAATRPASAVLTVRSGRAARASRSASSACRVETLRHRDAEQAQLRLAAVQQRADARRWQRVGGERLAGRDQARADIGPQGRQEQEADPDAQQGEDQDEHGGDEAYRRHGALLGHQHEHDAGEREAGGIEDPVGKRPRAPLETQRQGNVVGVADRLVDGVRDRFRVDVQDQGGRQLLAHQKIDQAGERGEREDQIADQGPGALEQGPAHGIEEHELDGLQQGEHQREEACQLALLGKCAL